MQKFLKNCKGAVTVFVTLLLIPAILVTGTGVDIARIYAARSTTRDANQLALNATLASYDSLLKELYGLFAVTNKDDKLASMVDTYIKASLYGEDITDAQIGEFRLFLGSEEYNIETEGDDALDNVDILRWQIEEYSKYRAPVAIVINIIDLIENKGLGQVDKDADAIEDKIEIDEEFEDLVDKYVEIYERIWYNDHYGPIEQNFFNEVNTQLGRINAKFSDMQEIREEYLILKEKAEEAEAAAEDATTDEEREMALEEAEEAWADAEELEIDFMVAQTAIKGYADTITGKVKNTVDDGIENKGDWPIEEYYSKFIKDEPHYYHLRSYEDNVDELISLCSKADAKAGDLREKIKNLREKLPECSEGMQEGMNESLTAYEGILKYELYPIASKLWSNTNYINNNIIKTAKNLVYGTISGRNVPSGITLSMSELKGLNLDVDGSDDLDTYAGITSYEYTEFEYQNNLKMLRFIGQSSGDEVFKALEKAFGEASGETNKTKKKNVIDAISDMLGGLKESIDNGLGIGNYSGAEHIPEDMYTVLPSRNQSSKPSKNESTGAPLESDFGNKDDKDAKKQQTNSKEGMKEAKGLFGNISGVLSKATNRLLLLTYDTEMFSCYITAHGDKEKENVTTMAGYDLGKEKNYLYQGEQEYLFRGAREAKDNLGTVTALIFLVRLIFNYISTFQVEFVKYTLGAIESALAASVVLAPFATVLKELARVVWALLESATDVVNLREGKGVPLLKRENKEWQTGPGIMDSLANTLGDSRIKPNKTIADSDAGYSGSNDKDEGFVMYYSHYMTIFLLFVDENDLAARTADLIALNVTNKGKKVNADAGGMEGKTLFPMDEAYTRVDVTTTVDLRFMFLSLGYAQGGRWTELRPPKTFPIIQSDSRGY